MAKISKEPEVGTDVIIGGEGGEQVVFINDKKVLIALRLSDGEADMANFVRGATDTRSALQAVKPTVVFTFQNPDGTEQVEEVTFQRMEDFGPGLEKAVPFLAQSKRELEQLQEAIKKMVGNIMIKRMLGDPNGRVDFLRQLDSLEKLLLAA